MKFTFFSIASLLVTLYQGPVDKGVALGSASNDFDRWNSFVSCESILVWVKSNATT